MSNMQKTMKLTADINFIYFDEHTDEKKEYILKQSVEYNLKDINKFVIYGRHETYNEFLFVSSKETMHKLGAPKHKLHEIFHLFNNEESARKFAEKHDIVLFQTHQVKLRTNESGKVWIDLVECEKYVLF